MQVEEKERCPTCLPVKVKHKKKCQDVINKRNKRKLEDINF
jgi:hypothetical protein